MRRSHRSLGTAIPVLAALAALAMALAATGGAHAAGEGPGPQPEPDPIVVPDLPESPAVPGPLGRRLLLLPFLPVDANIVFVMNGSMTLSERQNVEMRKAARRTLKLLDLRRHPDLLVGVVSYDDRARELCELSNDERELFGCVGQVRQRYGNDLVGGLETAYIELLDERPHAGVPLAKAEIVLVFTDGHDTRGCSDVVEQARSIKANGMRVITVAVGSHADTACLADVATGPADVYAIATGP